MLNSRYKLVAVSYANFVISQLFRELKSYTHGFDWSFKLFNILRMVFGIRLNVGVTVMKQGKPQVSTIKL